MGFGWCCGFGGGETFGCGDSVLLGIDLRWVLGVWVVVIGVWVFVCWRCGWFCVWLLFCLVVCFVLGLWLYVVIWVRFIADWYAYYCIFWWFACSDGVWVVRRGCLCGFIDCVLDLIIWRGLCLLVTVVGVELWAIIGWRHCLCIVAFDVVLGLGCRFVFAYLMMGCWLLFVLVVWLPWLVVGFYCLLG